jgi:L-amino acid N-acyltransferase YncA
VSIHPVIVRPATAADAAALAAIYGHDALHGTGTFEEQPPSPEEMAARLRAVQERGLPWVAAEVDGQVLAYAYAAPYRLRSAYRYTAEDSVYVAPQAQGRGLGRATLQAVIEECQALGLRRLVAVIGDSGNAGSLALHRALGFQPAGVLPAVGFKHGRWLDVVLMHRALNAGETDAPTHGGLLL